MNASLKSLLAALALATSPAAFSQPDVGDLAVSGTLVASERVALPDQAKAVVELIDVSHPGDRPRVISDLTIFEPRALPLHFTLDFPEGAVAPGGRYAVQARIMVDERVWFGNPIPVPAITHGAPSVLEVRLARAPGL